MRKVFFALVAVVAVLVAIATIENAPTITALAVAVEFIALAITNR